MKEMRESMNRKSVGTVIQLSDEQKKAIMEEIAAFYLDERDEEIGMIEQSQLLDLFLEQLAPIVYNKALDDAIGWYKRQQENIESDYYLLYKD